ncbi:MAG: HlyD family secretion protein [Rhodobacteraceae bacterium]|nr:HlyD family secretion protein [Paracoccaceae bacterium]
MKTKPILAGLALVAVGAGLGFWWTHERLYPSTEDAYVQAHILNVAPQVSGRIAEVAVAENDHVAAGDLLFRIDDKALRAAVDLARARADAAMQSAGAAGRSVAAADAQLEAARAARREAEAYYLRQDALYRKNDIAKAALDTAIAARDEARAKEKAAQEALASAREQLGADGKDNADVRAALAQLNMAEIDLDHATVTAPIGGWVAQIDLQPGAVVAPGQILFALVGDDSRWIEANFKETDLTRLTAGQPVHAAIDLCPDLGLTGHVASIGPGAGAVFSLLPEQNASGNWVKVTRRIPVRIALNVDRGDMTRCLRAGASASVTVDTTVQGPDQ